MSKYIMESRSNDSLFLNKKGFLSSNYKHDVS